MAEPLVYSVVEVAKLLDLSRNVAYRLVREGAIPSLKLGGRILIPRAALEKMIADAG